MKIKSFDIADEIGHEIKGGHAFYKVPFEKNGLDQGLVLAFASLQR